jgi:preprotein translocase subunit SecY
MVGRKIAPGGQTYLPLRVNYSGVMPIIFASAILTLPQMIVGMVNVPWVHTLLNWVAFGSVGHMTVYAILVFFFSYFWVATVFNPIEIADNLKKYSAYIPGVRPGKPTAEFLDRTMIRLTFAGATALTIVAVIPDSLYGMLRIDFAVASFFGGTSLLIVVGVLLDTLRQVETHLITRNYEGFLGGGPGGKRIRGRL